eukprot:7203635-Prymnesium_polylepis.1
MKTKAACGCGREGQRGWVGSGRGGEGGRVGITTSASPHTCMHTHARTHRGIMSARDRHSVPAAE